MVESVGKVGVGRVGVRAGSQMTIGNIGCVLVDPDRAKCVARRSNRLASAIIGHNTSSIPSHRSSINKLSALSF